MTESAIAEPISSRPSPALATFMALLGFTLCHLLNDAVQSLLPAIYPLIKPAMGLSFAQIGLIGLVFQITASVFQPVVGTVFDARPSRWPLPAAMLALTAGLMTLARADSYPVVMLAALLIGLGSAVFHPEASRGTRLSSGGSYGFAQSLFQSGGNIGAALGPLLAAFLVAPQGQKAIFLCVALPLLGVLVTTRLSGWLLSAQIAHREHHAARAAAPAAGKGAIMVLVILTVLICTKNVYTSSMQNYYSFLLIERFGLTAQQAQVWLFVFLAAVAAGTLGGGLLTDRIGVRRVINISILGTLPFSLALPHMNLSGTVVMSICVGLVLSSAFSAIVVHGQELMPHRVGLVAGLFFGLAFGVSGIAAAGLGLLADAIGLQPMMVLCSILPAAGLLSLFLPDPAGGPDA